MMLCYFYWRVDISAVSVQLTDALEEEKCDFWRFQSYLTHTFCVLSRLANISHRYAYIYESPDTSLTLR